jgi:hypothetical protein
MRVDTDVELEREDLHLNRVKVMVFRKIVHLNRVKVMVFKKVVHLTPISTMFQLYHGG